MTVEDKKNLIERIKSWAITRTEDSMPKGQHIPIPFIINLEIKNKIFYSTREEVIEKIRLSLSE